MRGMKKLLLIFSIILAILIPVTASAADNLYRLMHNDQQALVIAEVVESKDELVKFRVEKSIESEQDLNISSKVEQLELESFTLNQKELTPIKFYENIEIDNVYNEGDIYLVSLNQLEDGYEIAWGIYELSSSDYENLDVLHPANSPQWRIMEAMAIKEFINTDGYESEFTFDGDNKILKSKDRVVYDAKSVDEEDAENPEDTKDNEKAEDVTKDSIEKAKENIESEPPKKSANNAYENIFYVALAIGVLVLLFKGKVGE